MEKPTLVLSAQDPELGRPRILAVSGGRDVVAAFLCSLIAEADAAAASAGPCAALELAERDRLILVAQTLGTSEQAQE